MKGLGRTGKERFATSNQMTNIFSQPVSTSGDLSQDKGGERRPVSARQPGADGTGVAKSIGYRGARNSKCSEHVMPGERVDRKSKQ